MSYAYQGFYRDISRIRYGDLVLEWCYWWAGKTDATIYRVLPAPEYLKTIVEFKNLTPYEQMDLRTLIKQEAKK